MQCMIYAFALMYLQATLNSKYKFCKKEGTGKMWQIMLTERVMVIGQVTFVLKKK